MINKEESNVMENVSKILGIHIEETLGEALNQEIKHCKKLRSKIEEQLNDYVIKSAAHQKQNSLTGYLFESYEASRKIQTYWEEYINNSPPKAFSDGLVELNSKSFQTLNINFQENVPQGSLLKKKLNNLQESLWKALFNLFKKRDDFTSLSAHYLYFQLVFNVLQNHLEKLDAYEKGQLDILLNLWDKCKIIETNSTILSKHKYDLETSAKEIDCTIDFNDTDLLFIELNAQAEAFIQSIKTEIEQASENLETDLDIHLEKNNKQRNSYNEDQVLRESKRIPENFLDIRKKWQNTRLLLVSDCELELEISLLKYQILKGYFSFTDYVDTKFKDLLDEKITEMRKITVDLQSQFEIKGDDSDVEVINELKKTKIEFQRKLVLRLMPLIKDLLLSSEIPKKIDDFEKKSLSQFEALSESIYIIKNPVYDHPIESSEMSKISPHALVSFEMQPKFMAVFPALKNAIIRHLQEMQVKLDEIPEIIGFSIESSIGYYEDKQELGQALKVGKEGIKRAINKIDDLSAVRKGFYTTEVDFLMDKIDQLIGEVSEIANNESALQIKIRITKAKAIQQSKLVRDKLILNIKNILPIALMKIRSFYGFLLASSIKIRKQLEGETKKGFITSDVSDYLVETEEAVNRLPFVYQRLFKLEPLSTFDFYIERATAMEQIKKAYSRWLVGKFAPTIIVGEKGSGKTSFINRFLSSKSINEKVIYHDLHKENNSPGELFEKIENSLADGTNLQANKEFVDSKLIVVIDGIEKLFEAKINGFDTLRKTMQLISKTNTRVFWIVSSHLYSYKYLEKSINISDYFGYHIEIEDLLPDQLISIIEKRHNISGYRLEFIPEIKKKIMIPGIKHSDSNNQLEIKIAFFGRLQKIVKGNITQAFLYWMRSADRVTEDFIYIKMPADTNLEFIQSISKPKIEVLKNILIHNGISAKKHSEIFRIPEDKSELQMEQMVDDGVILKKSDIYHVNPMIYKQVIDQMYKLNLLH